MELQVQRATLQDKSVLRHLLELYQYDLSEIENRDVDANGLYGYEYLDQYWTEAVRHPFLVQVDGRIAGFVLVNRHTYLAQAEDGMSIGEFFIMKRYRGRGIGERVAMRIFDMFPGRWEVRELAENVGAQAFWRRVIGRYTRGEFKEVFLQDDCWHGPAQVFESQRQLGSANDAERTKPGAVDEIHIVDLSADDEPAIRQAAALLVEGFGEHWPDAWPDMDAALQEVHASFQAGRISRVAVSEKGEVLGWIGGIREYNGRVWQLHPLVVRPDCQRQGIGRALVADLEERVRERGGLTIFLGTDDVDNMTTLAGVDLYPNVGKHIAHIKNLAGHPYGFYQKLGYTIVGVVPDANGPGKPDILMAKRVQKS
jgi:aminoglycoside 6'-N-acetyltransferase I